VVYGEGTFNNAGTFTKASSDTTTVRTRFNNTGVLSAGSGTLLLENNYTASTSSGTYHVVSGATLRLHGLYAAINLNGNVTSTGTGTIEIAGAANVDGAFSFPGTATITGINYARLSLTTDTTTADIAILNMSDTNGTLLGPGHLTAGTVNWSAGTMRDSGSTTATNALNFTGSENILFIEGRTFNNAGTATWNKTGELYINPTSSSFTSQAGATFTVESSGSAITHGGGAFRNAGTLYL
jgi:hypothetical protein